MELDADELQKAIRKRMVISARMILVTAFTAVILFSLLIVSFYREAIDAEKSAAMNQMRMYVIANTENFETRNNKPLEKAARNLVKSSHVSHISILDPLNKSVFLILSPAHGDPRDTENKDIPEVQSVQSKYKLLIPTAGAELAEMVLPSGVTLWRAYTPVRKGAMKLNDVEIGFFKKELMLKAMDRLRIPGGVAAGCVLVLIMVVSANAKQWEGRKSVEVTEVLATQMDKQKIEYLKKFAEIKREQENKKEVDGGSFFNILEAIREISGSPDMASFVRRSVLSCVRLFRCRMVMFYSHQTPDGKPATWELMGRYDGKGYVHDVKETLSVDSHERLKEALKVGSTELLKGYPNEATQALLIAVAAERPLGALILYNKVGNFDAKDLMAARVFAGFLPNLLAWHVK